MTWLYALLVLGVVIGAGVAAFFVARSPAFWLGLAGAVFKAALPTLAKVAKPASPEELERLKAQSDRGQETQSAGLKRKWGHEKGW